MALEGDVHAYLVMCQRDEKMSDGYNTETMVYAIDLGTKENPRTPSCFLAFGKVERLPHRLFHKTRADALRVLLRAYQEDVARVSDELKKEGDETSSGDKHDNVKPHVAVVVETELAKEVEAD